MKKITQFILIVFLLIISINICFAQVAPEITDISDDGSEIDYDSRGMSQVKAGLNTSAKEAGLDGGAYPKQMAIDITGYALGFVGIIIFINIIFAGYQWIMSGGNEETISKAKNRIKNSIIGLVIIAAAYAITSNLFTILEDVVSQ